MKAQTPAMLARAISLWSLAFAVGSTAFELTPLKYAYNGLEPAISEDIMKLHHDKHFEKYLSTLKEQLAKPEAAAVANMASMEEILASLSKVSDPETRTALQNSGGGYYNHVC